MVSTGFTPPGTPREALPRLAATVLLLRDVPGGGLEVFLLRRHGASTSMGGAFVFPGGKVDVADAQLPVHGVEGLSRLSATPGRPRTADEERAIRSAALREVHEEAGLLLAVRDDGGPPEAAQLARLAPARSGARPLAELLAAEALRLDPRALVPWAHWITPSAEPRRFDTYFFVARAPAAQDAVVDAHEATEGLWLSPADAIARQDAGTMFLPPPTFVCLDELFRHANVDAVLAGARARTIAPVLPKLTTVDGAIAILLPWDGAYAATEGESLPPLDPHPMSSASVSRVVLDGERWRLRNG